MSISPRDLLGMAQRFKSDACECARRAAVSRAYYAAFHHAYDWHWALPSPGAAPEAPGGKHHDLASRLASPTLTTGDPRTKASRMAGYLLRDAHAQRVSADYKLAESVPHQMVDDVIAKVERIFSTLA